MNNKNLDLNEEKIIIENISYQYVVRDVFFNKIEEEIKCSICLGILIDPYICLECQNSFCKKCLNELAKKNDNQIFCPSCNKTQFMQDKKTQRVIEKLMFNCKNCGITQNYEKLKNHILLCKGSSDNNYHQKVKRIQKEKISQENIPHKKVVLLGETTVGK